MDTGHSFLAPDIDSWSLDRDSFRVKPEPPPADPATLESCPCPCPMVTAPGTPSAPGWDADNRDAGGLMDLLS